MSLAIMVSPPLADAWTSCSDYQNITFPSLNVQLFLLQTPWERAQCALFALLWRPSFL